jgi:hypothetical protein
MRLFWILILTLVVGCTWTSGPEPGGAAPSASAEAGPFLGLPDDRSCTLGDEHPESALAGVETMTKVQEATYEDYLEKKKGGKVSAEQRRGRHVYFAVTQTRHVPFPNGSGAYLEVVERYKAPVPEQE